MTQPVPSAIGSAAAEFLALVGDIRPELHRYCARLTGSVIEGEDIVQDTLAKAFYALTMMTEPPPMRPWLFRIAHNAALDFLKSHGRKLTDPSPDLREIMGAEDDRDPVAARLALTHFLALPVIQRSAVILKDVLGHSLDEAAETMETTVMGVKAALVRGRAKLREAETSEPATRTVKRDQLDRYASLFNARDWDGLRALIGEDCRLDLVSRSQRRGKEVGMYFGRYAKEDVAVRVVELEGQLALAAYVAGANTASYFILLVWDADRLQLIRDFRYVPYIATDAVFTEV